MRALLVGKVLCLCSLTLLFCVLSYQAFAFPRAVRVIADKQKVLLTSVLTHADAVFVELHKMVKLNSTDVSVAVDTITIAARDSEELISDLRVAFLGGKDTHGHYHTGVTVELTALLSDLRKLVNSLQVDVNGLAVTTGNTLVPLQDVLRSVDSLTATLERQVNTGSPDVINTVQALNKSVNDFDALLRNEDIAKALANAEKATFHTAQSMESVDLALQPWRRKAGLLKTVVGKLFTVFKFTWAF